MATDGTDVKVSSWKGTDCMVYDSAFSHLMR